ncbi:MAG: hypothetical protein JWM99_104 [Verrucomicrobiales bacterium]|nr:hypothetical protein [Verrucomicrobiales bacterium]
MSIGLKIVFTGSVQYKIARYLFAGSTTDMNISRAVQTLILLGSLLLPILPAAAERPVVVRKWGRFEHEFKSTAKYANPVQEARLAVVFTSPSGESTTVNAFWDGGKSWKVRFSPNEVGKWLYSTACSDPNNVGLEGQKGSFLVTASSAKTRFDQHGPVTISHDGRYLIHEDGTPFFWLADTAWNAALLGSPSDLVLYTDQRVRQKFTAVQWVATQWRAAPQGDAEKHVAFNGKESISINPEFFQRLDERINEFDRAGLLSAPVMLWAIAGGSNPAVNPGYSLPEDQAILLGRYMVARWGAHNVLWILAGDGDYRGKNAEKWKRIGRGIFGDQSHAPVTLHPGGMQWVAEDFKDEPWYDVIGYQSGHGDDEKSLRWLTSGPPAQYRSKGPVRPIINLEPPYENHIAYQSRKPITPELVRRAVYWSLLITPTAGVTYGGHGVWGWDDGSKTPTDHPTTGIPMPWREALQMPAAKQMVEVATLFNTVPFWRLRPAQALLASQPGDQAAARFIAAASTDSGDFDVIYIPEGGQVEVRQPALPPSFKSTWFNPREGTWSNVVPSANGRIFHFSAPGGGDWVLVIQAN